MPVLRKVGIWIRPLRGQRRAGRLMPLAQSHVLRATGDTSKSLRGKIAVGGDGQNENLPKGVGWGVSGRVLLSVHPDLRLTAESG